MPIKDLNKRKAYDRKRAKIYYIKNKEQRLLFSKNYYQKNKEKKLAYFREKYPQARKRKIERQKELYQEKGGRTAKEKIDNNMGYQIWRMLKTKKGGQKWQKLVGYSVEQLMAHLEKMFDNNMNWNNYGSYWSIDHIKPVSIFNYQSAEDDEFKQCWSLDNLRPLNHIENIRKSNKYEHTRSN